MNNNRKWSIQILIYSVSILQASFMISGSLTTLWSHLSEKFRTFCRIWGSHGNRYGEFCLLVYNAVQSIEDQSASCWYPACLVLWLWRRRWHFPLKCMLTFNRLWHYITKDRALQNILPQLFMTGPWTVVTDISNQDLTFRRWWILRIWFLGYDAM
jgi:hypothetical protein